MAHRYAKYVSDNAVLSNYGRSLHRLVEYVPTPGVLYTKYQDRFGLYYYSCDGIGDAQTNDIVIADNIDGVLVTQISDEAFGEFVAQQRLTSVVIPGSVDTIGNKAFYAIFNLTSVTIGNGVTSIGNSAFYGCSDLTSVTIGDSVTSIGDYAFSNCGGLTSITLPDSMTTIGNYAFSMCTGLTSITIPDRVVTIGNSAFATCHALKSITIPNSVTSIGDSAFANCGSYYSVTIKFRGTEAEWNNISKGDNWSPPSYSVQYI